MDRKPYTVENMRPRRTVHLYGRTLAPRGRGRTSCMDLSQEQFEGTPCQRLLDLNRIRVVRGLEAPKPLPVPEAEESDETPPDTNEESDLTPPEHGERGEEGTEDDSNEPVISPEESGDEDDGTTPPTPLQDTEKVWTESELNELKAADQKVIVESRGLDGGTNAKSRIKAILDAQGGQ